MAGVALPDDYRARPARMEDAEAVARVISACEVAHDHGTQTAAADVRDDWQDVDLEDETIVVEDAGGMIVASCDLVNRGYAIVSVYGFVDPAYEDKGLGRYLIDWSERWTRDRQGRADPDAQIVVRHYIQSKNKAAVGLFDASGYEPVRHTFVMGIDIEGPPPEPVWPDGVVQAEYRPGVDERDVYEAVQDAFRDTWGHRPSPFERFLKFSQGEGVKPDLWILARAGDEIAGICLGTLTGEQGWIPTVGVRRAWRRKGLGLALLHAGFGAYHRRGVRDVRLSVDAQSLTGANRLYERAGMHVKSDFILFEKVLREGSDIGVSSEDA